MEERGGEEAPEKLYSEHRLSVSAQSSFLVSPTKQFPVAVGQK